MQIKHKLAPLVEQYKKYVLSQYKYLHQHPELSWKEFETVNHLMDQILSFEVGPNYQLHSIMVKGGIVANLVVDDKLPFLLFRAEVDALPILEETGLAFASKTRGIMHACGHDMHTAMLLGALKILLLGKLDLSHNLRFVFQRAEERGPSGAASLIESGVLKGVKEVHGLHICSEFPLGEFHLSNGKFLASSSSLDVLVKTKSCHTANNSRDSFKALDEIWGAINNLGLWNKGVRLTRRSIEGTRKRMVLRIAIRSQLVPDANDNFRKDLRDEIKAYDGVGGASVKLRWIRGHPAVVNDKGVATNVGVTLVDANQRVVKATPHFASDDFGHYLNHRPGCYMVLGAADCLDPAPHHSPFFLPSPEVLSYGVLYWLLLAQSLH